MSSYFEKFRNPRWQKKRLKIMEKAGFKCEGMCLTSDRTLNVHHGYYEKDLNPWDYDDDTLWCLCEVCHEQIRDEMRDLHFQLAKVHPVRYAQIMRYLVKYQAPQHGGKNYREELNK